MERESTQTISREQKVHQFFCDECGAELGVSTEYDDGYYAKFGEYNQQVQINGVWYKLHANYCPECAATKTNDIISAITNLGFNIA